MRLRTTAEIRLFAGIQTTGIMTALLVACYVIGGAIH